MTRLPPCLLPLAAMLACSPRAPSGAVDAAQGPARTFATDTRLLDVLFVVDNSGSMQEEQAELARAFFELDPERCPIADPSHVPSPYQNVDGDAVRGELAGCGLLQLLGAEGYDWRVGVITTDVDACDDMLPAGQGQLYCTGAGAGSPACSGADADNLWGFRPQRGCLQPGGPPGSGAARVLDPSVADPAGWFRAVLDNVRTFGSPWERGLDAAETFLDDGAARAPECQGDLAAFRRPAAALLVVVLSDEDDCSRGGAEWVVDETVDPASGAPFSCGEHADFFQANAQRCYDDASSLPSAASFADRLLAREPEARVVVVGGALDGHADGCTMADGGADDACFPSGGLSNLTGDAQPCGPGGAADEAGLACCTADPATRYEQFVDAMGARAKLMSICEPSLLPLVRNVALALIGDE